MGEEETQGGSTATAPAPAPTEAPGAGSGDQAAQSNWMATAAPKPEAESAAPGAAPAIPEQPMQTVGVPVTSLKRGGLLGVVDSIADVLAGTQRPELGKDPDGNLYVKQHSLSRGEQWLKIAGQAMHGAAAGLAAGRGRGNGGKAALAGFDVAQQDQDREKADAKDMNDQARQQMLDNANNQMLRMKMAEEAWRSTRLQTEATQHDIEFAQGQEDRLAKSGATLLGTVAHPGDLSGVLKVNPDLMKDLVHNHALEFTPHYTDGKPDGFKVFKTPQGYRSTLLPPGTEFPTFNSVTGGYDWHKTSDPATQGEIDDYWTAAGAAGQKFKSDKVEQDLKTAQAGNQRSEAAARNQELPGKIAETAASTAEKKANASKVPSEIAKNWAEAHAADAKALDETIANGAGPAGEALVDTIGTGKMPVGKLAYLLARKPELMSAVARKYPDFDGSKIDSYVKTYQDFTSGKASVQLNSGGTALMHLRNLQRLNTVASHIPHTPAWTAYQNQAATLSTELANFYGNSTIPAIKDIRDSLSSTLPGNRQAAIKTQSQSMSKKFDEFEAQWKAAAPSAAYEAQMPKIGPEAEEARAALDPDYAARKVVEAQHAGGQVQLQPGEVPHVNPQTGQQIVPRDGQWVDIKTGLPVKQ